MAEDKKESRLRWKLPDFSIAGRTLKVELTGWPLVVFVIAFVLLVAAIVFDVLMQPDGWLRVGTTLCFVLLPILISLLLAPRQKADDHSQMSLRAVDDLLDLQTSHVSILDDLNEVDSSLLAPRDHTRILTSIGYLSDHLRLLHLHIAYWTKVSPTVAQDLADRENEIKKVLAQKAEFEGSAGQHG
jgi:hypothetical protein